MKIKKLSYSFSLRDISFSATLCLSKKCDHMKHRHNKKLSLAVLHLKLLQPKQMKRFH